MSLEMSASMRNVLINHLDQTRVAIIRNSNAIVDKHERVLWNLETRSRHAAVKRGWLKRTPCSGYTVITEAGRYALAAVLADWADALARVDMAASLAPTRPARTSAIHRPSADKAAPLGQTPAV